jgi:hypothetical protein
LSGKYRYGVENGIEKEKEDQKKEEEEEKKTKEGLNTHIQKWSN